MLYPSLQAIIIVIIISVLLSILFIVNHTSKKTVRGGKPRHKNKSKYMQDIRSSTNILTHYPNNVKAIRKMADAFYELGEWEKAYGAYQKIIDRKQADAVNFDVLVNHGIAAMHLKKYNQAFSSLSHAQRYDNRSKKYTLISYYLGMIEYRRKNYASAINHVKLGLSMLPTHYPSLRLLALTYCKKKRYTDAQTILSQIQESMNNDPALLFASGECYHYFGDHTKAIEYYKLVANSPIYGPSALLAMGKIMVQQKESTAAAKYFSRGLEFPRILNDIQQELHYSLANIYSQHKDIKKSLSHLKAVHNINPTYKDVANKLYLLENQNLYTYLRGNSDDITRLCTRILPNMFPKRRVRVTSTTFENQLLDIVTELRNTSTGILAYYLVRFVLNDFEINEVTLRELNSRLKETGTTTAVCVTAGSFAQSAQYYAQQRSIHLIDKNIFMKMLNTL